MLRLVTVLVALAACKPDCELQTCPSGKQYQSCVEGKDLVVRYPDGREFARCKTDYGDSGVFVTGDKNNCADKHLENKDAFCAGSASTGSTGSAGDTSSTGNTGNTGPTSGTAHCYKQSDNSRCECTNTPDATLGTPVSSCSAAVGLVQPICCIVDSNDKGTKWCSCVSEPKACREDGSQCACPQANTEGKISQVVASCSTTGGRVCCQSNSGCTCGGEQYPGSGCIGFGALNESPYMVSSCTGPLVMQNFCGGTTERTSCDGLTWAP